MPDPATGSRHKKLKLNPPANTTGGFAFLSPRVPYIGCCELCNIEDWTCNASCGQMIFLCSMNLIKIYIKGTTGFKPALKAQLGDVWAYSHEDIGADIVTLLMAGD